MFDCYREETPNQVTVGMPGHSSSRSINLKAIARFAVNLLENYLFSASAQMDSSLSDQSARLQKSLKSFGSGFDKGYGAAAFEIHSITILGYFFQYFFLCA